MILVEQLFLVLVSISAFRNGLVVWKQKTYVRIGSWGDCWLLQKLRSNLYIGDHVGNSWVDSQPGLTLWKLGVSRMVFSTIHWLVVWNMFDDFFYTHRIHGAGIYANIWGILMVNVTIYVIHGSYGIIYWDNPSHWRTPSFFKMGTLHHQADTYIRICFSRRKAPQSPAWSFSKLTSSRWNDGRLNGLSANCEEVGVNYNYSNPARIVVPSPPIVNTPLKTMV